MPVSDPEIVKPVTLPSHVEDDEDGEDEVEDVVEAGTNGKSSIGISCNVVSLISSFNS